MTAKLVDMKYTKAEAKEEAAEYTPTGSGPEYPWGLQIRLEDEELKKLGISSLPDVGAEMTLTVNVKVTGVNESQYASGKSDRCVSLQITEMGMQAEEPAAAPAPAAKAARKPSAGGVLGRS